MEENKDLQESISNEELGLNIEDENCYGITEDEIMEELPVTEEDNNDSN